ncbi:hypothetical protein BN3661_02203 [Eubacteriaceae bacterium CHKCI005]|nr:hypothetical protein BN3661_02203 [Eubacteriaceae bacterium CHKCI005]
MSLIAKGNDSYTYDPIPEGQHIAVCYAIVDEGVQHNPRYDNSSRKVRIMWELPEVTMEYNGETVPRVFSKEYTLSLGDKSNLRKDLQAWRGKAFTDEDLLSGFNLSQLIGKGCILQMTNEKKEGKTYTNITGIMALMRGMQCPPPHNPPFVFDLENPECLSKLPELPKWLQERITQSETYKKLVSSGGNTDFQEVDDDDLPF